jgi:Rhodopirellula transposase DDE domain
LDRLVEPDTRGDPDSPLRWTCKSTRELAEALTAQGHPVSDDTVGRLLKQRGYRLQRTVKTLEGARHADRDAQFRYLNEQAKVHLAEGQPVVSVDTKREGAGRALRSRRSGVAALGRARAGQRARLSRPHLAKAIPYGVYDLGRNAGWVSVGVDHDTAAFAVATLRRWWEQVGQRTYPAADRLLITADAGGSNGYRVRAWKLELAKLAQETGRAITVCHPPPGTSKWNRIEHRLFSAISMNWRGRPLESHEVIVELIGATTTHTGLRVRAELDRGRYPLGSRCATRSWRRCRSAATSSTASGTTPFNQRLDHHGRQVHRAGTPKHRRGILGPTWPTKSPGAGSSAAPRSWRGCASCWPAPPTASRCWG